MYKSRGFQAYLPGFKNRIHLTSTLHNATIPSNRDFGDNDDDDFHYHDNDVVNYDDHDDDDDSDDDNDDDRDNSESNCLIVYSIVHYFAIEYITVHIYELI